MPMPIFDLIDPPAAEKTIQVYLDEARSAVHSLLLLVKGANHPGLAEWVTATRQSMSRAEYKTNELVIMGLHYAVLPAQRWSSFPAYIDHLASMDPAALRDKMLAVYEKMPIWPAGQAGCEDEALLPPPAERTSVAAALTSADAYLAYLRERFPAESVDEPIERAAYELVSQPAEMQRVIVEHFRGMWRKYLSKEWQRSWPILQQALQAVEPIQLGGLTFQEAASLVTGQDLSDERWLAIFSEAKRLVLIPHPHTGPYVMKMWIGDGSLILFFGAHVPRGSRVFAPDLDRAELLIHIEALADDTRLRILRQIAQAGELRSQQIMEEMDLSQSAASRQLTQLTAAGYLKERRCEGAKCYSLNPERVSDTLHSLASYLLMGERSRS